MNTMSNAIYIGDLQHGLSQIEIEHLHDAAKVAASWSVVPRPKTKSTFLVRAEEVRGRLQQLDQFLSAPPVQYAAADERMSGCHAAIQGLRRHFRLLPAAAAAVLDRPTAVDQLPRVVLPGSQDQPRIAAAACEYLRAVDGDFSESTFRVFVLALQKFDPLTLDELWDLGSFLRFELLESILNEARNLRRSPEETSPKVFEVRTKSLRTLNHVDWEFLIEPLIVFDGLLRQDPAGAYEQMDFESRELYRRRIAQIARRSDCTETQVAQTALDLARNVTQRPADDPRLQKRLIHVGYYLIDKGFRQLAIRVGYHPSVYWRIRRLVADHPDDFYITGIQILAIFLMAAVLFPILPSISSMAAFAFTLVVLLFPAMQVAIDLVNNAVTSFFDPVPLPKLDFSKGVPSSCTTLVAVPSLLLNEKQVHDLVHELEVRYVANRDPNIHFALVTDLADSVSRPNDSDSHPHVELAIKLVSELNARYRSQKSGALMVLHRHRIFNTRQGVWMGWERKRGKLLDLNKLLMDEFDAFPIKAGGLDGLRGVRYILTLDSDTQLPRGSAARMVGAIAHPLNQAIIDPKSRVVVEGYGILQPRIGVTVSSTFRSRFASIYSGQSGFDIYTHATSDAYQDLFGEGIFTGKGIYEVAVLHAVLDRRFPRNSLLSHDLIEGSYARVGLVSDIELIDDYPSHYSAYSRRHHRWVRGDWQIAQWIFSRVPDESGKWVPNPISDISRWKIFDNLRRSLVDPFLLLLFVSGWLGLPGGPVYWTIIPLLLLFFPTLFQLGLSIGRALASFQIRRIGGAFLSSGNSARLALLHLVFLGQQACLTFDAILRSLIRSFITGERLLEWETAAQSESRAAGRAGVDRYLFITPFLSAGIAVLLWFFAAHRYALYCAAPILLLWAVASPVSIWLDRPPVERPKIRTSDVDFLLVQAVRIWRYFCEFGTAHNNYLVPDNVEEAAFKEAQRISPTNIGLLLNARQAACELGFLTVPEFAALTSHTLATIDGLQKYRGHLYNWYDTKTLQALTGLDGAAFISTVDSGNFVASLYTLRSGARDFFKKPLLQTKIFVGVRTYWHTMRSECKVPATLSELHVPKASASIGEWIEWLPNAQSALAEAIATSFEEPHKVWWLEEALRRIEAIGLIARTYMPWMLPEYKSLTEFTQLKIREGIGELSLEQAIKFVGSLEGCLADTATMFAGRPELRQTCERLNSLLAYAKINLNHLYANLLTISEDSRRLAEATDFSFLVDPKSDILFIGFDAKREEIINSHYDLLASEARVAAFLAIARGDLPQESWFKLSRDHAFAYGDFVLLSWTGTMFEYLMPAIWMRSYPDTLLARTLDAVVRVQRAFASSRGLPWGISESGHSTRDDSGNYGYFAFGVPDIAVSADATSGPVISPYSTFLALSIDPEEAIANLHRMVSADWLGTYGLYEAIDYRHSKERPEITRAWMAHHQGMSLLAIVNLLCDSVVQRWFHANAMAQSVERLLHEVAPDPEALKLRVYERNSTKSK
jgi:cyclic beta-1,2-glucan synthetase